MRYAALRLVCFFDLPMETNQEKRIYRQFRKELIANGFEMLQFSVYVRTCPNRSFANKFYKRLQKSDLPFGNVRLLAVTEKQFSEMFLLVGGKTKQEEVISNHKLVVI
ncbi:MAG: CRISPR-associated endonuclease Cas2 [Streptococcus sp.]|nr:CRISPR-associated endonuclease Cas2 [Streptococcus sp.]